jgi:xanthine dehydrogenase YagR molybdenum-binding subunit
MLFADGWVAGDNRRRGCQRPRQLGELGNCGSGAAVMNAIYNATGARIRDFPATPGKLLATLEALDA